MNEELTLFFYNLLTQDPDIAAMFGNKPEWLYLNMAEAEASPPFIVHAIDEGAYGEHSQIDGQWNLSVYTAEVSTRNNQAIAKLIKRKFNGTYWRTEYLPSVQLSLRAGSGFVPTGNTRIHRQDISFAIRYSRSF